MTSRCIILFVYDRHLFVLIRNLNFSEEIHKHSKNHLLKFNKIQNN